MENDLNNAHERIIEKEEEIRNNGENARQYAEELKEKIVATEKEWRDKKDEAVREKD